MPAVKIVGTGKYLPKQVVTALHLSQRLNVPQSWIETHTGVMTRYFVKDETASFMGAMAAKEALKKAGLSFSDIDCLVCTSGTMEQPIPCTASLIQEAMGQGESGVPAFDVNSTCLSFLAGLDLISYMMAAGRYRRVLLVATEIASKGLNWDDKESCCLFGDGAAAVVIEMAPTQDRSRILHSCLKTYSKGARLSEIAGGGSRYPALSYGDEEKARYLFAMDGPAIFKLSAKVLLPFYQQLLAATELTTDNLALVIPHQASQTACTLIRKRLNIPKEKFWMTLHNHGNTIAASLPMGLHEAITQGKLKRGDKFMLLGTSAGFSVGGMILEY